MLASLFENGDVGDFKVVVFGLNLRRGDKAKLRQSCGSATANLQFRDIDASKPPLSRLMPTRWSLSPANYSRLILPDLLSDECDRLIFLDSDMLIHASLRPLSTIDLAGFPIGAVREDHHVHPASDGRLPLPAEIPYLNAGLLVVDVARWRAEKVTRRCFSFIKSYEARLRFAEQDALNCVLIGGWKELPRKWNFIHRGATDSGTFASAVVTHFAGGVKPWSKECAHPARNLFFHYRAKTPWRNRRLTTRFERRMGKLVRKRLRYLTVAFRRLAG